jgi:hypothetical protein
VRYWRLAAASRTDPCPNPPFDATVVHRISHPITDTQVTIFRSDDERELIVAVPGASTTRDFLSVSQLFQVDWNAPFIKCSGGCKVHAGTVLAWASVEEEIVSALRRELSKTPGYKLVLTGHSLGGAIVTLGYASLKSQGFQNVRAYTYGAFRVGNKAAASHIDKLSGASDSNIGDFIRVTHRDDGAPKLLPTWFGGGYSHTRTEIWQDDTPAGNTTAETTYRCFGQEPTDCNNGEGPFTNKGHEVYSGLRNDINNCE